MKQNNSKQSAQPDAKIQSKDRFKEFLRRFNDTVLVPLRYEQLVELRSRVERGKIEIFESDIVKRYHPHPAHSKSISRASLEAAMQEMELLERKYGKDYFDEKH